MAIFVERMLRRLPGYVVLLWDGGPMHQGEWFHGLLQRHRKRLWVERLPPYCPELNPGGDPLGLVKYDLLCNFAPADARELLEALSISSRAGMNQTLLAGFFHASDLPLPRTLLS